LKSCGGSTVLIDGIFFVVGDYKTPLLPSSEISKTSPCSLPSLVINFARP